MFYIFCPYNTGTDGTGSQLQIKKGLLPYLNGNKLPLDTSFCWSDRSGLLQGFLANPTTTIPSYGTITFTASTVMKPKLGQ
jgi:hypothetical protein